jgi:hypothetical protein
VLYELAEELAPFNADRLSWDDTAEGERLRRYELSCKRACMRMLDLLLKARSKGGTPDFAAVASVSRFLPARDVDAFMDQPVPSVATVITAPAEPVEEPVRPIEANSAPENAPNEPNLPVQESTEDRRDGHKELRIDPPHPEGRAGGIGLTGKGKIHQALHRLESGRQSPILNLSKIFE